MRRGRWLQRERQERIALEQPRAAQRLPVALNMLSRCSMKTIFLEIAAGAMIFAAINVAYFEIRRLISHQKAKFDKARLSRTETPRHVTLHSIDLK
jgi:hypothetical protein